MTGLRTYRDFLGDGSHTPWSRPAAEALASSSRTGRLWKRVGRVQGRIGRYAKLVHAISDYDPRTNCGMALCRVIEGKIRQTVDEIDCARCLAKINAIRVRATVQ